MAKLSNYLICLSSLFAFLLAAFDPNAALAENGNVEKREFVCMMQDTVMLKKGIPVEHKGRTYYACCPMCIEKLKADPTRHTKAQDPVTGATLNKAAAFIYNLDGFAFYFASEASREAFGRDPGQYIAIK
jgi:YHS domain-containing protein